MSLPDHLLDEPDYCEEHGLPMPCKYCYYLSGVDKADQLYDEWMDRQWDDQ